MQQFPTSAGLYRGLLYNLVKTNKKASIKLSTSGGSTIYLDRVIDNIIDYDDSSKIYTSATSSSFGQWIIIELLDRFIDLKAYAMGQSFCYPRHWDIMVSMDGNEWNTPHKIRDNDDSKNGYIFKFAKHIGFIRFFKIINRGINGNNGNGNTEQYISNIDLYGNVVKCNTNCTVLPHICFSIMPCQKRSIGSFSLFIFLVLLS